MHTWTKAFSRLDRIGRCSASTQCDLSLSKSPSEFPPSKWAECPYARNKSDPHSSLLEVHTDPDILPARRSPGQIGLEQSFRN
jgi:hypothetical protein